MRIERDVLISDAHVAGHHVRIYTLPASQPGYAIQIARSLSEVDRSLSSIRLWLFLVALVVGTLASAVLMLCFAHTNAVIFTVIALGLIAGQPAGPVMALPARVLSASTRAIGMGIFYTIYYGTMMLGPTIGGAAAKWTGSAAAAFDFGAVVLLACPLLLWVFNLVAASRVPAGATASV